MMMMVVSSHRIYNLYPRSTGTRVNKGRTAEAVAEYQQRLGGKGDGGCSPSLGGMVSLDVEAGHDTR